MEVWRPHRNNTRTQGITNSQSTNHTQSQKKIPKTKTRKSKNVKREKQKGKGKPKEGSRRLGKDVAGNAVTKFFKSLKS